MAEANQRLEKQNLSERRTTRRAKYIDAVSAYFEGDMGKARQAQQFRLDKLREKIKELSGKNLSTLHGHLSGAEKGSQSIIPEEKKKAEVQETLAQIAKSMGFIEKVTEVNLFEREIKKLEALIKRLEKQLTELNARSEGEPNLIEQVKNKINELEVNKLVYMMGELFKADTSDNTVLRGRQLYLIEAIEDFKTKKAPDQTLEQYITNTQSTSGFKAALSEFLEDYRKSKREQSVSQESETKIISQQNELQNEKNRYKRSARLHALFEKLLSIDFDKPGQKYSAVELERFVKLLEKHYQEITTSEELHIQDINKQLDLTKIEELINNLKGVIDDLKKDLNAIETDGTQPTERRIQILKAGYQRIQAEIVPKTSITEPTTPTGEPKTEQVANIHQLLEKTDYEAQVDKRIELANQIDNLPELVRGFEEFSEAHMREYEQIRKLERDGTAEQREAMAKAFLKSRLMEEFADTEKVRLLYGTSYRRMWEKISNRSQRGYADLRTRLVTELEEMFGLEDGDTQSEDNKKLKTKLTTYLDKCIKTQQASEQLTQQFETSEPDKAKIMTGLKADIANAIIEADGLTEPDQAINDAIENLLKSDNEKQPAFEIVPTPNGIAIVLSPDKINELKTLLFGKNQYNAQESIGVTLRENPNFNELASAIAPNWNGSIMLIASESDEYTMMHETQHAIARAMTKDMNEDTDQPEQPDARFNEAVEEIATRFSSGEIWRELAFPQDKRTTNINLSLTGLAYIRPETDINPEDKIALYNFIEVAKTVVRQDIENTKSGKLNPQDQNLYGEIISEIMLGNIDSQGKFDIAAATTELKTRFAEILEGKVITEKQNLEENDISGGIELENSEKSAFDWIDNNKGFIFDMVGIKDIRGRPNIANDLYMDKKIGIEKAGKEVSSFGSILQDIPIIGTPLGEAYAKRNNTNIGSTEYEVNDFWLPFLFKRNYKTRNRAFGGVWRKFSRIPFIGDSNEKMTKFGASPKKMLNDLPPFGRGWEMILQEFLASKYGQGIDKWIKKEFPGRDMDPIETTKMNATEIWSTMTSQEFLVKDLGEGGLGLKHDQIKRVLAHHPMMSIEYTGAQANFEYSRANLDSIDEITGIHKGALTLDLVAKLEDSAIDSPGSQFKPKDGTKYKYKDEGGSEIEGKGVKWQAIELAEAMARAYDKDKYSYTINDLINAAHLCHDLGISGADPKLVRNDYYATQPGYDKEKFVQQGDKMVSEFMWYSLENPDIRGVNIQGELFSLDAAHELLRRYHYYFIKEALSSDIPEMTVEMQALNAHEILYTPNDDKNKIKDAAGNIITLDSKDVKRWSQEFAHYGEAFLTAPQQGQPAPPTANSLKDMISLKYGIPLSEEIGIAMDEHGNGYNIYKAKTVNVGGTNKPLRNPFYNPNIGLNSVYANNITGLSGSEKLSKKFLTKNMAELDGYVEAVEDGLKFSNEYTRRLAEISQYERMAYYRKTFWGDFKLWVQRIGNLAMLGSLIGAGLTGSPFFAALILGTMAIRIPAVIWMSKIESTYGNRRVNALQLLGDMSGKMGMYKEIMGKPVSRLDKFMLNTAQSDNESKMEDLAKAGTPEGTYPSGDLAFKFANIVFGEKGLVAKAAGG